MGVDCTLVGVACSLVGGASLLVGEGSCAVSAGTSDIDVVFSVRALEKRSERGGLYLQYNSVALL